MGRMRTSVLCAFLLAGIGSARAGFGAVRVNDFEIVLFGRAWHVSSYFVQDDLLKNASEDTFLNPEGLAFRAGILYASGDRESDATDSRLAVYTCSAAGALSFSGMIQMPNVSPDWWGPEGLAFNTAGTGYGGGAGELVSVERDTPSGAGVINLVSGAVSNRLATEALEDITYLPRKGQFAVLVDLGTAIRLAFYDMTMAASGEGFAVLPGSNGLVGVSPAFGSWFTWTSQRDEIFVIVSKAAPGNAVAAYTLEGNPVGPIYKLPVEPKARIPLGGGFYRLLPAFGTVEAVTVDEANRALFIGDEQNAMIHVLTGGRPAVDFDADGDVDLADFGTFQACFNGPNRLPSRSGCAPADLDGDGDVDLADFGAFQSCFNGPNRPAACP
ncbi:MAG: hypothetical protein ACPMAQ_07810 [Phycisphaerae bacterium]